MYKASVSPGSVQQIMPYFGSLCYNGSLDTWTVVCLTAAKFKPLIFSVTGFALSNIANIFVNMILSTESESEAYITTDSQSTSLSWNKAPIWGLRPDIY
jgi:hypothetical protein